MRSAGDWRPSTVFHAAVNCCSRATCCARAALANGDLATAWITAVLIQFIGGRSGRLMSKNSTTHSESVSFQASCR